MFFMAFTFLEGFPEHRDPQVYMRPMQERHERELIFPTSLGEGEQNRVFLLISLTTEDSHS